MKWERIAALLAGWVVFGAAAPAPPQSTDLATKPPTMMTGTVEQRNAAIKAALDNERQRVEQLSMQEIDVSTALRMLSLQIRIDMQVDWDSLEKKGIKRDVKTTLNLYKVSTKETIRTILWLLRPDGGSVGYKIENGTLVIGPQADGIIEPETETEKKLDQETTKKLLEKADLKEARGAEVSADALLHALGLSKKVSIIVDWAELEKIGVRKDATLKLNLESPTGEEVLKSAIAGLKPTNGAVAYDIRAGIVRISTDARLKDEKKREPPDAKGLP